MSAILVYGTNIEDKDHTFDFICSNEEDETEAFESFKEQLTDFTVMEESWEDEIYVLMTIEGIKYKVEFLYIDEPSFVNPISKLKVKIEAQNMVYTPENVEELTAWIEDHPREDKAQLWIAVMMTWNLAAKITNKEED